MIFMNQYIQPKLFFKSIDSILTCQWYEHNLLLEIDYIWVMFQI